MFIHANHIAVHVALAGPPGAPALLMLHSLGTDHHVWDSQAQALSGAFRVICPDLRGHGLSEVTPGPYTMAGLARDGLALLDALGVRAAHVAGLSIGGLVAQAMAHEAPERVLSLTLCATALVLPPPSRWLERAVYVRQHGLAGIAENILGRWTTPAFAATAEARGLATMLGRTAPEGYAAACEALAAADLTAATAALRLPALVLVGDRDTSTPPPCAAALRDAIPGAELIVIEDAAHICTVENGDAVSAAMRRFLLAPRGDRHEVGLAVRQQVLGEAHVARAFQATTELDRDFQRFITETAWGGLWARPHFDRRTRSIVTLALLAALGREEELAVHVRAMRNTGATAADLSELILHVAVYAGVPAANTAMRVAKATLMELGER